MQMYVNMKIKKIGGSLFGRFPSQDAKELKLRENQEIKVQVMPRRDYMSIFGMGRHLKIDAQKFKDELREEDDF
mgnify:CR=1 FL=1